MLAGAWIDSCGATGQGRARCDLRLGRPVSNVRELECGFVATDHNTQVDPLDIHLL